MRSPAILPRPKAACVRSLRLVLLLVLLTAAGTGRARAAVELLYFEAVEEDEAIQIRWGTASELDTAGFYVTRSLQENGVFERLNLTIIPSQGDGLAEQHYVFTDQDVNLGTTYYYKLETVNTSGASGFTDSIEVTFGVVYTATPTLTGTRGTATPTPTGPTGTPTNTATPTLTGTLSTGTPTRTRTATVPGSTSTLQPTTTGSTTVTITVLPSESPTPTWTTTFVPLPRLTLLFPVLSPTPTATHTATLVPIPVLQADQAALAKEPEQTGLEVLGGMILLLWLVLGGFLVVYLRRIGY